MSKIVAIINQKGGVGKTTTSINMAAGLSYLNKRVLLIDFDPQGNASNGIGFFVDRNTKTILDAFEGCDIRECIYDTESDFLKLIPSTITLSSVELGTSKIQDKTYMLKNCLNQIRDDYDYIIIDCPPALSILSQAALSAADSVLIPIQSEYFALEGATQLLSSIREIQKTTNPNLKLEGVIITMVDNRTKLSSEIQEEVKRHFKEKLYSAYIPRNIELSKATAFGQSIFQFNCASEGAKAYTQVVSEFLKKQNDELVIKPAL